MGALVLRGGGEEVAEPPEEGLARDEEEEEVGPGAGDMGGPMRWICPDYFRHHTWTQHAPNLL